MQKKRKIPKNTKLQPCKRQTQQELSFKKLCSDAFEH